MTDFFRQQPIPLTPLFNKKGGGTACHGSIVHNHKGEKGIIASEKTFSLNQSQKRETERQVNKFEPVNPLTFN